MSRRMSFTRCTLLFTAVALAACTDSTPTSPTAPMLRRAAVDSRPRHLIVLKNQSTGLQKLADRVRELGGQVERQHDGINALAVRGLSADALSSLRASSDVAGIALDRRIPMLPPNAKIVGKPVKINTDQSGAFFFDTFQWNLKVVQADKAWLVSNQGKGTEVCDLDTGIDPTHIDLVGKVDLNISTSFVESEPDILDRSFHGTFVSALMSTNGLGMASVAPDAKLCAVKVLDQTGSGSFDDVISGIIYASDKHVDVINMSFGAYFQIQTADDIQLVVALQRAIDHALKKGTLPVAAAGNEGVNLATDPPGFISIPAQLLGVISVGATGPIDLSNFDHIPSYSNVGFPGVQVFAPGGGDFDPVADNFTDLVFSACSSFVPGCEGGTFYVFGNGTSFAAPHVSAEALVIQSDIQARAKPLELTACIDLTTDHPTGKFIDPIYGFGRINLLKASSCGHPLHIRNQPNQGNNNVASR